jgi:hypothetical protein
MESAPFEFESVARRAGLLQAKGDYGAAEPLLREVLDAQERVLGPDDCATLASVTRFAYLLRTKGHFDAAESLYRRALDAREQGLGPEHPDTLQSAARLAGLLEAKSDLSAAEPLLRRVLDARERALGAEHADTLASVGCLANLLEKMGNSAESAALRMRVVPAQFEPRTTSPPADRGAALELYSRGNYPAAEALLAGLLARDFEPASTHCHLARICLVTDRRDSAREHVSAAWAARDDAPTYVVARILWLQLTLALLDASEASLSDSGHPTDVASLLGKLKTVVQSEDSAHEWAMEPVLDHLESRLAGGQNALLAALVAALSGHGEPAALDALECWKNQAPIPVDD